MLASMLRSKVKLQEKTIIQGPLGQVVIWKPIHEYYARVIPLDVRTIAQFMQLGTVASYEVVIRKGVTVTLGNHRILWRGKTLEPTATQTEKDEVSIIPCKEI